MGSRYNSNRMDRTGVPMRPNELRAISMGGYRPRALSQYNNYSIVPSKHFMARNTGSFPVKETEMEKQNKQ